MPNRPPRILAFAGALRKGSFNKKLIALAVGRARAHDAEVDLLDLADVMMPLYDGDLEDASGLPPGAVELRRRVAAADAVIISTPEYNGSIPGVLKNAIDWSSRPPSQPWRGKIGLVLAASAGGFGGVRALMDLRRLLATLGALVVAGQLGIPRAGEAFDDAGELKAEAQRKDLDRVVGELVNLTGKLIPG